MTKTNKTIFTDIKIEHTPRLREFEIGDDFLDKKGNICRLTETNQEGRFWLGLQRVGIKSADGTIRSREEVLAFYPSDLLKEWQTMSWLEESELRTWTRLSSKIDPFRIILDNSSLPKPIIIDVPDFAEVLKFLDHNRNQLNLTPSQWIAFGEKLLKLVHRE